MHIYKLACDFRSRNVLCKLFRVLCEQFSVSCKRFRVSCNLVNFSYNLVSVSCEPLCVSLNLLRVSDKSCKAFRVKRARTAWNILLDFNRNLSQILLKFQTDKRVLHFPKRFVIDKTLMHVYSEDNILTFFFRQSCIFFNKRKISQFQPRNIVFESGRVP